VAADDDDDLKTGTAGFPRPWWGPHARLGDVSVYHVDLAPAESVATALGWLDESEMDRLRRYLVDLPRRQFTLCRAALRILLGRRLGCPNNALRFGEGRRGKPFALVDEQRIGVSFNVSHSGDHGMIAIAPGGRLGIDIEVRSARNTIDQLIATLLTEAEQNQLQNLDPNSRAGRFYDLWTAKEALVKASGLGHAIDVARLDLSGSMGEVGELKKFRDQTLLDGCWEIANLGTPVFAAALARAAAGRPIGAPETARNLGVDQSTCGPGAAGPRKWRDRAPPTG
jgi:4'-phosphopantetheinyl transferase